VAVRAGCPLTHDRSVAGHSRVKCAGCVHSGDALANARGFCSHAVIDMWGSGRSPCDRRANSRHAGHAAPRTRVSQRLGGKCAGAADVPRHRGVVPAVRRFHQPPPFENAFKFGEIRRSFGACTSGVTRPRPAPSESGEVPKLCRQTDKLFGSPVHRTSRES
jgi:hypothetical protein